MTTIYLVRHANSEEWPDDTENAPLTPDGERQAEAIAERLKNIFFHVIYTSSFKRSKKTAKIIAKSHKQRIIESNEALIEVDFRVRKRLSLASFAELQNFYTGTEIEQIERLLKAQKRTMKLLQYLFKKHPDQKVLVVTHGNVIKAMVLGILELKLARFQKFIISEGSISTIQGTNRDDSKILTLNEVSHLKKSS